jgi:hypothetical protein
VPVTTQSRSHQITPYLVLPHCQHTQNTSVAHLCHARVEGPGGCVQGTFPPTPPPPTQPPSRVRYCVNHVTTVSWVAHRGQRTDTSAIPSSSPEHAAGTGPPAQSGSGAVRRYKAVPFSPPGDRPGCQRVAGGHQRRSAVQPAQDERHPPVVRILPYG